jgi:hypothetical protein
MYQNISDMRNNFCGGGVSISFVPEASAADSESNLDHTFIPTFIIYFIISTAENPDGP